MGRERQDPVALFLKASGPGSPTRQADGQSRSSLPVMGSSVSLGAGPSPRQVTVPAGTSVRPASSIQWEGTPRARARRSNPLISSSVAATRTIFGCPARSQAWKRSGDRLSASRARSTAACATWAAALPGVSRSSPRTTRTILTSCDSARLGPGLPNKLCLPPRDERRPLVSHALQLRLDVAPSGAGGGGRSEAVEEAALLAR